MGKYSQGILGAFSGKVGTVVGASWRGIKYMRSLAAKRGNARATEKQLEQQARFALIAGFLKPVKPLLELGFKNYAIGRTGYNSAASYNLKNALTGQTPNLAIDYSMVLLSRGDLVGAKSVLVSSTNSGQLDVAWQDNSGQAMAKPEDQLIVAVFSPALVQATYLIGGAERQDESFAYNLPADFSGETAEVYISWVSADMKEVATSVYAGSILIA